MLFYSVPASNPSAPASSFYIKPYEDDPLWFNGYGTDPASQLVWLGPTPGPEFGPVVGTEEQWLNGLDYETWFNGGYVDPVPCVPLAYLSDWDVSASWFATITHGPTFPAIWPSHPSWTSSHSSTAVYTSVWSSSAAWSSSIAHGTIYASTWTSSAAWSSSIDTASVYASTWTSIAYWLSSFDTASVYASTWARSAAWSSSITTGVSYASTWLSVVDWSAIVVTVDNVISFLCQSLVATGTTQATAALIASDTVNATSTGANQGVILPAGCYRVTVYNANSGGGNSIKIYPPSGAQISALGTNNPTQVAPGFAIVFVEITSTLWKVTNLS